MNTHGVPTSEIKINIVRRCAGGWETGGADSPRYLLSVGGFSCRARTSRFRRGATSRSLRLLRYCCFPHEAKADVPGAAIRPSRGGHMTKWMALVVFLLVQAPAPAPRLSIAGRVVTDRGQPLHNAAIQFYRVEYVDGVPRWMGGVSAVQFADGRKRRRFRAQPPAPCVGTISARWLRANNR